MSLKRFNKEFDKATSVAIAGSEKAIKHAVNKLFKNIIDYTPVDTGQLKGNWEASIDNPSTTKYIGRLDSNGAQTVTNARNIVNNAKMFDDNLVKFYLTNNLDYANRIEYGQYSDKAPYGMVRVNVLKFKVELDNAVKKFKV